MEFFQTPMFKDITKEEWEEIQKKFSIHQQSYEKNSIIFHMGDLVHEIGMVLKGSVHIENIDLWGNKSILSHVQEGQIFAETYALCQEPMMVHVVAATHCQIAFLDMDVLLDERNAKYSWYTKMLRNMLGMAVHKNLILSNRIFCTTAKTIRSRLFSYLSAQSIKAGSTTFQIPFNRQQLADYLNLDRSALSKELGKMRQEGLLEFYKNTFKLRQSPQQEAIGMLDKNSKSRI